MKNLENKVEQMTDETVNVMMSQIFGKKYDEIENLEDCPQMNEMWEHLQDKVSEIFRNLPVDTDVKINLLMRDKKYVDTSNYLFLHIANDLSAAHLVKAVEYNKTHGTFLRIDNGELVWLNDLTESEIEQLYQILLFIAD